MNQQDNQNSFYPGGKGMNGNGRYYGEKLPSEANHLNDSDDEIDLRQLLSVLLRYKWSVILFTLVFTVLAGFIAFSQLPVYQSDGTILIAESQNRYSYAGADLSNLLSTTYGIGMGSTLSNELQVFQSRRMSHTLAENMVEEDLMENGTRFPILWRSYPEDSTVVARDSVAMRIRQNMTVERVDRETDLVRITFESYSPAEAAWMVNEIIDTYTSLSLEQNREAATSALTFLKTERDAIEQTLSETEDHLRRYMNETGLIQVDEQTRAVIGRVTELEGQRQELQVKKVAVSSAIEAYEDQLNQIKPGLADQFSDNVGSTLERYQFRLAELETERLLLLQRNPRLRENPEREPYLVDLNDQIDLLKGEINRLASQLVNDESDMYLGFLNNNDNGIAGRITELRSKLIELRVEESQLRAQEKTLNDRLAEETNFFNNLPDNMIELARLQRDTKINEQLFLTISQQYAETALWEQTQFGQGRPLDYGYVPEKPSQPNKRLFVMIGFLLGGIAGAGYVFIRESLNNSLDGTDKLRQTGHPVLAVIPQIDQYLKGRFQGEKTVSIQGKQVSTALSTLTDSISPISESYRRLHNNIIYSHPDENFQTILVTSSAQGEGKTTVSANLATVLAESGKKVLIIDMDLRRPALHNLLGETRQPGLTDVLFDDIPESEVIKNSVSPGVDVITSGHRPPNPAAIMQSSKLKKLVNDLKEKYDHIILDSAPYGIITDAAPLMRLADGVVLVVRFNKTKISELNITLENLKRIRTNLIGTVLTAYNYEKSADYYSAGQGYYNYHYAYQEYSEKQ